MLILLSCLIYHNLLRRAVAGRGEGILLRLGLACALLALHCVLTLWLLLRSPLQLTTLTHDAMIAFVFLYLMFHSVLALAATLIQISRYRSRYISEQLPYEFLVLAPWWTYTTVIAWSVPLLFAGLPWLWIAS